MRRERTPSKSGAIDLYRKRKTEVLQGRKLPETLLRAAVSFREIAEDAIADITRRYRRPADDVGRLRVAIGWLGSREAASLSAGEIDAQLSSVATKRNWCASTINHYRSVLSLAYRIARRDRKLETNPVRDVTHRRESNSRVRCLNEKEEQDLRAVIRKSYPTHEAEFEFALHTGLRQGSQFQLTWNAIDLGAGIIHIPRTKNERP